jgi:hypothetical protein
MGARITSRMFFGGRLYPEAVSFGAAGLEDAVDCATAGANIAQTNSAPIK